MSILSNPDHNAMDRFLRRVLELHASGVIDADDAVGHIMHVVGAVDLQSHEAQRYVKNMLEGAWSDNVQGS